MLKKINDGKIYCFDFSQQITNMEEQLGLGDKKILRGVAQRLGLVSCSVLVKRAIQFGSRIAKQSNISTFGSNNKGKNKKGRHNPSNSNNSQEASATVMRGGEAPLSHNF